MASSTRRRVPGEIPGRPFSTFDAVEVDTPAAAATCSRVGLRSVVDMPDTLAKLFPARKRVFGLPPPRSAVVGSAGRRTGAETVSRWGAGHRPHRSDRRTPPLTTLHVAVTGSDRADGSPGAPFRTFQLSARAARPGDTVRVHAGTYREWVRPPRGGVADDRRITFEAAPGEHVVLTGAEVVTGWVRERGDVWRAEIPNTLFGDLNPFDEPVAGDWLHTSPGAPLAHRGDVYLAGRSLHEVHDRAAVVDPDRTILVWYAEVGADVTTVWANFGGADPTAEVVEVNVRPSVFTPERAHVDYITVRGFELAQAATPWAPPTADQLGLVGPRWARGWVIEDNLVRDSKCAGVSLGKDAASGDNESFVLGDKPGYQYQLEAVFTALHQGWEREHVGSHVVRRNEIRDCGQNGVVGHLGCAFSTIADNHIHHIGTKHEFSGYEVAGIKLHAPLDVTVEHNRVHDTTLGIWLD